MAGFEGVGEIVAVGGVICANDALVGIRVGVDVNACVLTEIGVGVGCSVDDAVATGIGVEAVARLHPDEKMATINNRKPGLFLLGAIEPQHLFYCINIRVDII